MSLIYSARPFVRVLSLMLICCLLLVNLGAIQLRCNAAVLEGAIALGAAGAIAAGSILPIAIAATLLVALGVAFVNRDALVSAAGALASNLAEDFDQEIADDDHGKIIQFPQNNGHDRYKYVFKPSNNLWERARAYVAAEYDPGEMVTESSFTPLTLSAGTYTVDSPGYILPGDFLSALTFSYVPALIQKYSIDLSNYHFAFVRFSHHDDGRFDFSMNLYKTSIVFQPAYTVGDYPSDQIAPIVDGRYDCFIAWGTSSNVSYAAGYNYGGSSPVINSAYAVDESSYFVNLGSFSSGGVLGVAFPDVVDNPNWDFVNPTTGNREFAIPVIPASEVVPDVAPDIGDLPMQPDVELQTGQTFICPDTALDPLINAEPAVVTEPDLSGGYAVDPAQNPATDAPSLLDDIWKDISPGVGPLIPEILGPLFGWLYEFIVGVLDLFSGLWGGIGVFFDGVRAAISNFGSSLSVSPFNELLRSCLVLLPAAVKSSMLLLVFIVVAFGMVKKL